jgi:hypothetical protein
MNPFRMTRLSVFAVPGGDRMVNTPGFGLFILTFRFVGFPLLKTTAKFPLGPGGGFTDCVGGGLADCVGGGFTVLELFCFFTFCVELFWVFTGLGGSGGGIFFIIVSIRFFIIFLTLSFLMLILFFIFSSAFFRLLYFLLFRYPRIVFLATTSNLVYPAL